jgi:hypothetical protein
MKWLTLLLLLGSVAAMAGESVSVCYNYGCVSEAEVFYSDVQLHRVSELLNDARSDAHERALIGVAVGWMLGWAGQQSPILADRGGNYADDGAHGRMDCIDHSTTTTRLLQLMERRGWLRFHRVLEPALRTSFFIFEHYSAQIEDLEVAADEPRRWVVDSWFFDNGQSAVVMPLDDWLAGEGPEVEDERE